MEGPEGGTHTFYINVDKNPATIRKEVLAEELKKILEPLVPDKDLFVRKSSGSIMVDRRPLVSVKVVDELKVSLEWNAAKRDAMGIDVQAVSQAFSMVADGGLCP